MQRLVQIANEVKEKFEGRDLLLVVGGGICQLRRVLLDLVDHAVVGRTIRGYGARRDGRMIEARRVEVGSGDLDVDEVPLPRLLPYAVDIGVSQLVRPGRRAGDVMSR